MRNFGIEIRVHSEVKVSSVCRLPSDSRSFGINAHAGWNGGASSSPNAPGKIHLLIVFSFFSQVASLCADSAGAGIALSSLYRTITLEWMRNKVLISSLDRPEGIIFEKKQDFFRRDYLPFNIYCHHT